MVNHKSSKSELEFLREMKRYLDRRYILVNDQDMDDLENLDSYTISVKNLKNPVPIDPAKFDHSDRYAEEALIGFLALQRITTRFGSHFRPDMPTFLMARTRKNIRPFILSWNDDSVEIKKYSSSHNIPDLRVDFNPRSFIDKSDTQATLAENYSGQEVVMIETEWLDEAIKV